jgi:hypothetical protein
MYHPSVFIQIYSDLLLILLVLLTNASLVFFSMTAYKCLASLVKLLLLEGPVRSCFEKAG